MHGMVGGGTGTPQDASRAPGLGQAAAHLLGEALRFHVVGAGGEKDEALSTRELGCQPRHLAIAFGAWASSRFDLTKAGGSQMTSSKRSPAATRRSISTNACARRKLKSSATPFRRAASSASAKAASERSIASTEAAPATAAWTAKPPL